MAYAKKPSLKAEIPPTSTGKRLLNLRRTLAVGFDWIAVDGQALKTALFAAGLEGMAVMISPAADGRGVCLKIFIGDDKVTEYATTADELNGLLEQMIDQIPPEGHDLRSIMAMTPQKPLSIADLRHAESVHASSEDAYKGMRKPIGE